jgi:ABC-2 type transport system ATP-binding protein
MPAVTVRNLVKNFGGFRALDGISFEVREGEIFGLIGPNGAGKTTTLRILSTLLQISSGEVNIFGHRLPEDANKVRRIISYLPEDAGAYKTLRGREYLEFIARFFTGVEKTEKIVERGLKIAQLGERINDKVDTYSKGMTRRLLVARALMIQPRLAILDEPSSGLDVVSAGEIRRIVREAVSSGLTVLLSSHNMLEVEYLCDRIALVNDGKIVAAGTADSLKSQYSALNIEDVFISIVKK